MILKRIKHARRVYDAKRPLFPGYIFVERPAQRHLWRYGTHSEGAEQGTQSYRGGSR
jgi:hypothetical protein